MSFSPAQCRAARALVEISRDELANRAGVAARTISDFEGGRRAPIRSTLAAMRAALEAAGVEFTNGAAPGVRMKRADPDGGLSPDKLSAENDG